MTFQSSVFFRAAPKIGSCWTQRFSVFLSVLQHFSVPQCFSVPQPSSAFLSFSAFLSISQCSQFLSVLQQTGEDK